MGMGFKTKFLIFILILMCNSLALAMIGSQSANEAAYQRYKKFEHKELQRQFDRLQSGRCYKDIVEWGIKHYEKTEMSHNGDEVNFYAVLRTTDAFDIYELHNRPGTGPGNSKVERAKKLVDWYRSIDFDEEIKLAEVRFVKPLSVFMDWIKSFGCIGHCMVMCKYDKEWNWWCCRVKTYAREK